MPKGEKIFYFKDLPDANEVKSLEYFIVYKKGLFIKKDITKIKFSMIQSLIHIGLFLTDDAYEYINSKDLESLLSRDDESHRIALN